MNLQSAGIFQIDLDSYPTALYLKGERVGYYDSPSEAREDALEMSKPVKVRFTLANISIELYSDRVEEVPEYYTENMRILKTYLKNKYRKCAIRNLEVL